ncbi:MAG: hypothetical protein ACR2QT_06670 [Woeseiaceae bacterium]
MFERANHIILIALVLVAGCAARQSLEELEDEAMQTGEWDAVERREEVVKKSLESRGPGCPPRHTKHCVEEQSGIQCYCLAEPEEHL